MIIALLFLILFALLFPKALRFLFALLFIGGVMVLGEVHANDGPNMSGQIQENGIVKYGSQPSKLIASSSPKIRAYDPVLAAAFIRAECDFYTRTYEPNSPEIAAHDWKTPFIHECQDRETAAMTWIADQWSTMPYKQYALCMAPYNRQLAEYGDTILAQQNMEYHQTYFMYEIIQSCMATGWPMPEGYWTKEDREMYLDRKYGPKQ
jgi:hypothetical protein